MHEDETVTGFGIVGCSACSGNHAELTAYPMPANPTPTTHYAVCPERTQIVLLGFPTSLEEDLRSVLGREDG